jgi:nucleoside-diphosphate-sugar epimerase
MSHTTSNEQHRPVLLTGATGFLGSALLRRLLLSGRRVLATVRHTSSRHRISDLLENPNLSLIESTPEGLSLAFSSQRIGTIIHTATEYGRGEMPVAGILDSNLILPIRLAELGVQHGALGFINTDSYFNKRGGSYSNLLNYSLSKRTLRIWLETFAKQINIANVMLEHIYGPFDSTTKFVEGMIQSIAIARRERLGLTHGHQRRDFVYIDDVVEAFIKILDHIEHHAFDFKTFEVGSGKSIQIRDFVKIIATTSQSPTILEFGALDYRDDEIMNSCADNRDIRTLGWQPTIEPQQGILSILNAYKAAA